jgi:hypothetical protein
MPGALTPVGWRIVGGGSSFREGHADDELGTAAGARAVRVDAPAVQLDQPSRDREADAEPALRAVEPALALGEEIPDARQRLGPRRPRAA